MFGTTDQEIITEITDPMNVVSTMCSAHVVQAVLSLPTSFFET